MPRHLPALIIAFLLAPTVSHAFTLVHLWSQRFGNSGTDIGNSVAVDQAGNVYVTGSFYGTVNFGGGSLTSAGFSDIFVAKFDASGSHVWSQRFGGTGADHGQSVALDPSGNVYLMGHFESSVYFGGVSLVSAGGTDIFLAKYDSMGSHQWSKRFGGSVNDFARSAAVDAVGGVVITGDFIGPADFGGGALNSAGLYDVYLAKFTTDGSYLWSQRFGAGGYDVGNGVAFDASGNVVLTGTFSNTVNFGGANLVSAGLSDMFLAKYDSRGIHQWSQRFGSTNSDAGLGVAVDGTGSMITTGYFEGTVSFGGAGLLSAGNDDVFIAKHTAAGVHQWSRSFGGVSDDNGQAVAVDGLGNVSVTGFYQGTVSAGGNAMPAHGSYDIFLARYDAAGAHQWSTHMGSNILDMGNSIAAGPSGDFVTTGRFANSMNAGGGNLVSAGDYDAYLVMYSGATAEPAITSITDIGNDQGRKVKIVFTPSAADAAGSSQPVTHYVAMRRTDAPPASSAAGAAMLDAGWTEVGSVGAFVQDTYSIDAPTIGDSTIALGQYYSVFFIRAATGDPDLFYDSLPDSGYSLDNLAPGVPSNFTFNAGMLAWDESSAQDFDFFTVYGAGTDDFGAATLVAYSVAPAMNVTASPYVYYFVTATDFSGNEGKPAKVNTLSSTGGTPKSYVLSVANYPNPFNPGTTVSYTVPARGPVTVAIYDTRGARVATLLDHQDRAAGAYRLEWDGRAADGAPVGSGVYFARIEHNGATRSKKMVLLK